MAEAAAKAGPSAGAGAKAASGPPANPPVKVKKWTAVAMWAYDVENDTCAICHNALILPCIACESEPNHEECTAAWGQCRHSYHFHCITRWLKTRTVCPLDEEEWDFVQF